MDTLRGNLDKIEQYGKRVAAIIKKMQLVTRPSRAKKYLSSGLN